MANLATSADLIDDVLFRAGEPKNSSSDFYDQAIIYVNRAYRSIWMGGAEWLAGKNEDWWWLRAEGSLILDPLLDTGTIQVTNNSTSAIFSSAPSASKTGWFIKVTDHPDVFKIASHTAAAQAFTLDTVYTGDDDSTANYLCMHLEYDLASDLLKLYSPMRAYQYSRDRIEGTSLRDLEDKYPLRAIQAGCPRLFAQVDTDTVRFSHYGDQTDSNYIRVDYDYLKKPDDLADDTTEPLVPLHYRHLISDMALYYLFMDKDDERRTSLSVSVNAGMRAMANENHQKWSAMGEPGTIYPRQTGMGWGSMDVPRTESGHILG